MQIDQLDALSPSTDKQMPKSEAKDSKPTAKEAPKETDQPLSVFSCATHPDLFLKLTKISKTTNLTCKSCGFKLVGQTGYLSCTNSKPCQVLCSSCKVCRSNHFLSKVFSLKNYEANPLYAKNRFSCAACKTEKEVNAQGAYHCGTCDYTLCVDCMRKEDQIWK